jgi:hypothetical protein
MSRFQVSGVGYQQELLLSLMAESSTLKADG